LTAAASGDGERRTWALVDLGPLLISAVIGLALVRLLVAAFAPLTDDEAYYRLWALAPAMSYFDHPPMVGWMIAAGRAIAGDTALGVRLVAVLASLVGPLVLWRAATLLFGRDVARRTVWIALAMPLMAVGGVIITPDTPSVLFWGLAAWATAELHVSRNANWWLAVGLFAGLGLLSKYTNLFVGAGILLWLVLIPENRAWFRSWQLWVGGVFACLLALPVVAWNFEHEWVSFAKQFGRVGRGQGLTPVYLAELMGGFLGLMSPIIAILAALGLGRIVRSAAKDQSSALIAAGMLPFLAYALVHALHDRVQPNWTAPLYPSFAICAAIALGHLERPQPARVFGRLGLSAVALGFLLSGLLYVHAVRPLVQIPGTRDPSSQMRGWPTLAAEVERRRAESGACWIATSSYATTAQLAFALKDRSPVVQLDERVRYLHLPPLDEKLLACPAIYVELERRSAPDLLAERFATVTPLGTVVRGQGSTAIAPYAVYAASGLLSRDWLRPAPSRRR
jgi:4-amino-4-deoxy-L-arabinose transferase-like glycosyltransferase